MDRIFLPSHHREGDTFRVNGSTRRHLADSLRVRAGERFLATDGDGHEFLLEATTVTKSELVADLVEFRRQPAAQVGVTLAIAPPKGSRMETALEKATEVGVQRIVPLKADHAVVKSRDGSSKTDRWGRVLQSATAQSGRLFVPELTPSVKAHRFVEDEPGVHLIAHLSGDAVPIEDALAAIESPSPIHVLIGPEGGFSAREVDRAGRAGATLVSLGPNRLRTETAAIVAATLAVRTTYRWEEAWPAASSATSSKERSPES